jgi:SecD-like export protein
MKVRVSTKIAVVFVAVVGLGYGAYTFALTNAIENAHFAPIAPTDVNLVGIDPGSGYRIIVANEIAQLVQASDSFNSGDSQGESGASEGAIKKRIPLKEMLAVLRGDAKSSDALGAFTMKMNDMKEDNLPPIRVIWTADDLRKAINGDKALRDKLEQDIVVHLDGSPLEKIRPSAIENGIVIQEPVQVTVNLGGQPKLVVGYVLEPYRSRLVASVESRYADKNYNRNMQIGYYAEEAKALIDSPGKREDVKGSLLDRISEKTARERAEPVERILKSATVVINDGHITSASYRSYDTSDGERSDLTIELTDEGRRRLWKYSRDKVGTQLLLIADGVAIEAPRIQHVLAEGELTITQMRDKELVRQAVDMINHHAVAKS